MPITPMQSLNSDASRHRLPVQGFSIQVGSAVLLMLLTACFVVLTGCGSSGYAGGGIVSLSASSITLDAGQAFLVSSRLSGKPAVSWSLASSACSAGGCGTLSSTTGAEIT